MNTAVNQQPGGNENQQNSTRPQNSGAGQENTQISQPHVERAEGPFEHSGETSGWTEEERKEKQEGEMANEQ